MPYYQIQVKLTKKQQQQFIDALVNNERVMIHFTPSQFKKNGRREFRNSRKPPVEGDIILVTAKQYEKIMLATVSNKSVDINFNKTSIKMMGSQVGNGILDSIGSFFKGATNTFNKASNTVKKWWNGGYKNPKPKPVELTTFTKAQKNRNKRHAEFEELRDLRESKANKASVVPYTTLVKFDKMRQNAEQWAANRPKMEYKYPTQEELNQRAIDHQKWQADSTKYFDDMDKNINDSRQAHADDWNNIRKKHPLFFNK